MCSSFAGRPSTSKSYTNADQIRDAIMTDDQLARVLLSANDSSISIPFCRVTPECLRLLEDGIIPEEKCLNCVKDWLKQPACIGEVKTDG